jgi:tetratricopeptide (TPR) repeat protein
MFGSTSSEVACAGPGQRDWWFLGLIVAVTVLAYWPALPGKLLWDDQAHVANPDLRPVSGLVRIWTDIGATQQYYPVLHSAFWLEHRLWGDNVVGYHLVNVLLHACSAFLVLAIMRRLALPGAWLAALIFALHPVEVESVAWISEQKNTLSGVFCLSAVFLYLDFDQTRRRSRYVAALGLFALAVLAKTVTGTLPAALLVVLWWKRGRISFSRDVLPLVPWFVLGVSAGVVTAWVERNFIGAQGPDFALTIMQRGLLAGRAACFYFEKLLWPRDLIFIYPRWKLDPGDWTQYVYPLVVVSVLVALVVLARTRRGPLAGCLVFLGTLVPALGFVNVYPFLYSFVADHFQYLAGLGIIIPASVALVEVFARQPLVARRWAPVAGAGLAALLAVLTWRQSATYRDSITLYRETLARNPDCWMAHNNLALASVKSPADAPEALRHYEEALRLKPDFAEAHVNLGNLLALLPGRASEARAHFEAALRIQPELSGAHFGLGNLLADLPGHAAEALAHYEIAVRLDPHRVEILAALADALARTPGRQPEAVERYEQALQLRPGSAQLHNNLGRELAAIPGRLPDAVSQFQAALICDPTLAAAQVNLGAAFVRMPGRLDDAIAQFQSALKLQPDLAALHFDLANALAKKPGHPQEAIDEYEVALRLDPSLSEAHYNLGNLYLRMPGGFDRAVSQYEAALKLRPDWESLRRLLAGLKPPEK